MAARNIEQSSTLGVAQPAYVLRGHSVQVHAVHFLAQNLRLLSGDAEGWVILWNVPIKRPVAVWKAHSNSILGLEHWDDEKIITHGRDNKLKVWQIGSNEEVTLSTTLPVDDTTSKRKTPQLLHDVNVNALNFCSFALHRNISFSPQLDESSIAPVSTVTIAVPGIQDGMINLISLPDESRTATIPAPKQDEIGMVMAIGLFSPDPDNSSSLRVVAGYESGHAALWRQNSRTKAWETVYLHKAHAQPILSLDIAVKNESWFTSSADAVVARHPLNPFATSGRGAAAETKTVRTNHAGQQSLKVRSDQRIFATAGWDGRVRVYSTKGMRELAVLKWHKVGCFAVDFAEPLEGSEVVGTTVGNEQHGTHDEDDTGLTKRMLTVSQQREMKTKTTHWLAAGSKDGRVSLWNIY